MVVTKIESEELSSSIISSVVISDSDLLKKKQSDLLSESDDYLTKSVSISNANGNFKQKFAESLNKKI